MRALLKTAVLLVVLLALALGIGLTVHWPASAPLASSSPASGPSAATEPVAPDQAWEFADQLRRLEAAVDAERRAEQQRSGAFAADLRTAAMRLSMSGPLVPLTQSTMVALGQRPALRRALRHPQHEHAGARHGAGSGQGRQG
jgi:hypothetical protein